MTDYLVDNSVWARAISGDLNMVARLRRIERAPADLFVTCPPQVLEFCHSARTPDEHERYRERISLGFPLERAPDESRVLDIQSACGAPDSSVRPARWTSSSPVTPSRTMRLC